MKTRISHNNSFMSKKNLKDKLQYIEDWNFESTVFIKKSALVSIEASGGWIEELPYHGQDYEHSKYKLIEDAWDHEHCDICKKYITEGDKYWLNHKNQYLCVGCYKINKNHIANSMQSSPRTRGC